MNTSPDPNQDTARPVANQLRTFELERTDGKPPALRHIAAGGLLMQLTAIFAAVLGAVAIYALGFDVPFRYSFTVLTSAGLTMCGISMFRRGVALRPHWVLADVSASHLTNFHHLVAVFGGGIILALGDSMLGSPRLIFLILESAFLLVYINFILLALALRVGVDRSTWFAGGILAAAWYMTLSRIN